jgi:hypothetical protein
MPDRSLRPRSPVALVVTLLALALLDGRAAAAPASAPAPNAAGTAERAGNGADVGRPVVVIGEIVAAGCFVKDGDAGRGTAHRECALRTLRDGGSPLVRDETSGALWVTRFPSAPKERERWLAAVGARVLVSGRGYERDGVRLLEVERLVREHDHDAAPHGGVVGMSGDRHVEIVIGPGREIRVYLLDEFMRPLELADVRGSALIAGEGAAGVPAEHERRAPLVVDAGGYLRVGDTVLGPGDATITVALEIGGERLTMTVPFEKSAQPPAHDHGRHHHH